MYVFIDRLFKITLGENFTKENTKENMLAFIRSYFQNMQMCHLPALASFRDFFKKVLGGDFGLPIIFLLLLKVLDHAV